MFEINTVNYYETQDGEVFKTYGEAEEHNKLLMKKEAHLDELQLRIFNIDGELVPVESIYDYDNVWFFMTKTNRGAEFLENYLKEKCDEEITIKPDILYRYCEDAECWISQEEELEELNSHWKNIITFEEARC